MIREDIGSGFSIFCSEGNHWIEQGWVFLGGGDKKKEVLLELLDD